MSVFIFGFNKSLAGKYMREMFNKTLYEKNYMILKKKYLIYLIIYILTNLNPILFLLFF